MAEKYPDNYWANFIEHVIDGDTYFRMSEYIKLQECLLGSADEIAELRAQLAEAQASERERCGKVVERHATTCPMEHMPTVVAILDDIRALSPTPNQEKPE